MDDRFSPASYFNYSPSGIHSPYQSIRSPAPLDRERYLAELFAERQKLGPFLQVLPFCSRLLNQEIVRASGLLPTQNFYDPERIEQSSPLRLAGHIVGSGPMNLEGRSGMQTEENGYLQRMGSLPTSAAGWNGSPGISTSPVQKKVIRMDIPVDKFPNFNFVGRLLGPRGNSLKRVEVTTQCRVYIRGHGSVKDSLKVSEIWMNSTYQMNNQVKSYIKRPSSSQSYKNIHKSSKNSRVCLKPNAQCQDQRETQRKKFRSQEIQDLKIEASTKFEMMTLTQFASHLKKS